MEFIFTKIPKVVVNKILVKLDRTLISVDQCEPI